MTDDNPIPTNADTQAPTIIDEFDKYFPDLLEGRVSLKAVVATCGIPMEVAKERMSELLMLVREPEQLEKAVQSMSSEVKNHIVTWRFVHSEEVGGFLNTAKDLLDSSGKTLQAHMKRLQGDLALGQLDPDEVKLQFELQEKFLKQLERLFPQVKDEPVKAPLFSMNQQINNGDSTPKAVELPPVPEADVIEHVVVKEQEEVIASPFDGSMKETTDALVDGLSGNLLMDKVNPTDIL